MPSQLAIGEIRAALNQRRFPSITTWNRLEARPRSQNFERALRAEIRDALWMLTKQWQMGEFRGSDAGSPVFAKLLFLAGVVYVVSPLDFLPDALPIIGELDDLVLFSFACRTFIHLCPPAVVQEHVSQIDRSGEWRPFGR